MLICLLDLCASTGNVPQNLDEDIIQKSSLLITTALPMFDIQIVRLTHSVLSIVFKLLSLSLINDNKMGKYFI